MTEQEKREKAIEEISQIIKKVYAEWGMYLPSVCGEMIYDYILRKEEEVQKKTAGEFYEYAIRFTDGRTKYVNIENLKEVASKVFGAEVEE